MERKDLIKRYLDAETTVAQERELAASFAATPPADEEERAVYEMMQAVRPIELPELPEAGEEFDRMVGSSRKRVFRTWGFSLAGVAAAIVAVVLFTGKPLVSQPQADRQDDMTDLFQLLTTISHLDPADAENYEFKPVGDGFVMTAHFPDGQNASYILTPLDGGKSFNLISLNQ